MGFAEIKSKLPINWTLIGNPVNWVIVFLMVAFAGAALAFILSASSADTQEN